MYLIDEPFLNNTLDTIFNIRPDINTAFLFAFLIKLSYNNSVMESFVTKLKIKRPSLIYTHEADLDGFMSGLILNMVSKVLFKKGSSIRYINYDTMDKIEFRPNDAIWISDLNFPVLNLKPQKNRIFIIDHHKWEQNPIDEQVTYLHDTTKSATLQCFELLEYVVNELENSTEKRTYKKCYEQREPPFFHSVQYT